jgi:nucleoside 2-deoxyribosyltransferase
MDGKAHAWFVACPWCGDYLIPLDVQEDIGSEPEDQRLLPYLSAHIRQSPPPVRVTSDWRADARQHARSTITEKVRKLLEVLGRGAVVGQRHLLMVDELPARIDARDEAEVRFLLTYLKDAGYITLDFSSTETNQRKATSSGVQAHFQLTVYGWESLSPVSGAGIAGTCFVAMSFDRELDEAYDKGMVPAIADDCGFDVIRIDRVEHNDEITDRIIAGIRGAEFVVADFTKQRPGVYFEAGFARGLGREVIWTCREDDAKSLHFDTRQRNHILWTTPDDLRQKLTVRIRGTISLTPKLG